MKPKTQSSIIGSILLSFAIAHISAQGQSPPGPGPEHEALKKLEGTYVKEKKTSTMTGEAKGPDGKMAKHKMTTHMPDDDHMTFTMYLLDADGQENKVMTIEYTRKK